MRVLQRPTPYSVRQYPSENTGQGMTYQTDSTWSNFPDLPPSSRCQYTLCPIQPRSHHRSFSNYLKFSCLYLPLHICNALPGDLVFFFGHGSIVVLGLIFSERKALTLDCVGKNCRRTLSVCLCSIQGFQYLDHVVTIDLDHMPTERFPLVHQILDREDLCSGARSLYAIPVDDGCQVVRLVDCRGHCCFPYLPLCELSIAKDGIHSAVTLVEFQTQSQTERDRESLAKRAGHSLDPGCLIHIRMSLEQPLERLDLLEFFSIKVA